MGIAGWIIFANLLLVSSATTIINVGRFLFGLRVSFICYALHRGLEP